MKRCARAFKKTVCDKNQLKLNKGNRVQRPLVIGFSLTKCYLTLNGD